MKEYLKDNKKVLIFTIIANFIIITLLLINLISLFKNLFNTPSSLIEDEFKVKSQNLGCQLIDKTKDNTYDGVTTYLISDENSCPYKMSYITFNNDNIKNFYFEQLTKDVLNNGGVITGDVNILLNGFHEYLTTGEYYKFVVLNNDNNLYYVSTEQANKKLINKEFKKYLYNVNFKSFKYIPYILSIYGLILLISLWGILKKAYNK